MVKRNIHSEWWGKTYPLSADEELDLVDIIHRGLDAPQGTPEYIASRDAINELVSSYSPLIEKVARERMSGHGHYGFSSEDFIGEAYFVAVQCAKTFNPYKSANPIRFSSYVTRAMISALSRINVRTRTPVSIPVSTLSKARQWSHVYHDLLNKGIQPRVEEISEICGSQFTEEEVHDILASSDNTEIDHALYIGVEDSQRTMDSDFYRNSIHHVFRKVYGDKAPYVDMFFGIGYNDALLAPFFMKVATDDNVSNDDIDIFFSHKDDYIHHPRYRAVIARELQSQEKKSHNNKK